MAKKKITIDDLAGMVKRWFDDMYQRFSSIDARFDGIDARFDRMEQRMVNLESGMTYLKARVGEIERTLDEHTELLEEHTKELQWIHKKIDEWTDPRNPSHHVTHKEFSDLESHVAKLEKKTI